MNSSETTTKMPWTLARLMKSATFATYALDRPPPGSARPPTSAPLSKTRTTLYFSVSIPARASSVWTES